MDAQWFRTLREAKALIEMWRKQYNHFRPYRALGYATPLDFAARWSSTNSRPPLRAVVSSKPSSTFKWIHKRGPIRPLGH